jgi:F-type H+-transporting ATPase subunit epsilon
LELPSHLRLHVVSAERSLIDEQVDEVQIPGSEGYLGVLPGHTPMLTTLQVGQLTYRRGTEEHYLMVAFGFAEILPDRVTILAEIAERAQEIDVARAEAARKRAEDRLASPTLEMDFERTRVALMKALVRLQVASRARIRS